MLIVFKTFVMVVLVLQPQFYYLELLACCLCLAGNPPYTPFGGRLNVIFSNKIFKTKYEKVLSDSIFLLFMDMYITATVYSQKFPSLSTFSAVAHLIKTGYSLSQMLVQRIYFR